MTGTLTAALLEAHGLLDAASVPHALCGGVAANLYREEVRATTDVDLSIAVGPAGMVGLVESVEAGGWTTQVFEKATEQLRLSKEGSPRVDCIVATTDYERAAIDRARTVPIESHQIPVLTAEDLIVFKLMAGRARDYEAVAAIINAQSARLDTSYITGWLEQFGIEDTWDRALQEAERESRS